MGGRRLLPNVLLVLGLMTASASASAGETSRPNFPSGAELMIRAGLTMGMMGGPVMQRHMAFMHDGLPLQYANLTNPLPTTPAILGSGAALYGANCLTCHGPQGHGDGVAGRSLVPPPSDISLSAGMPMPDNFFYWSISDGGQAFGSAMPAFRDVLKPEEIWAIISYLRAGLPGNADLTSPGR